MRTPFSFGSNVSRLPARAGRILGVALLLTGVNPGAGLAQESEGSADYWDLPLVAFEDVLDARVPAECLAEGEGSDAGTLTPVDAEACPALLRFGSRGPIATPEAEVAAGSWMSSAWSWGLEHWYVMAPMPLVFVGGGGGGGGGGGIATTDGGSSDSGAMPSYPSGPSNGGSPSTAQPVPEPSSWILFGAGALLVGASLRRKGSKEA